MNKNDMYYMRPDKRRKDNNIRYDSLFVLKKIFD